MCFVDLPIEWPVTPAQYGVTTEEVFDRELQRMEYAAAATRQPGRAIEHAYGVALDSIALCPCFLAVVIAFMEHTATPPELLFGFVSAFAGWCCNNSTLCWTRTARIV